MLGLFWGERSGLGSERDASGGRGGGVRPCGGPIVRRWRDWRQRIALATDIWTGGVPTTNWMTRGQLAVRHRAGGRR